MADALGAAGRLLLLRQVHGTTIVDAPWDAPPEADAAFADRPGLFLGIQTADCLPLLFVDERRRFVAAAHAGWRGTAEGIARCVVMRLRDRGSRPEDLRVALGPCIGPCCYEVSDDLRAHFAPDERGFFLPGPTGAERPHLDIRAVNVRQLCSAGVDPARIASVACCTYCHPAQYSSYRREGPDTGRMISTVGWRGE